MEEVEKLEAALQVKGASLEARLAVVEEKLDEQLDSAAAAAAAAAAAGKGKGKAAGGPGDGGDEDGDGEPVTPAGEAARMDALAQRLQELERRVEGLAAALEQQQGQQQGQQQQGQQGQQQQERRQEQP